ncbi:MAG: YihY/virulence factor BrkB family protein [Deltaproteobacteria bacterium]|nr:YihY/virulence factor BrkB family protein [Deltaproteobacteria bacterium]
MKNPLDSCIELYKRIDESGLTNWPLLAAALSFYSALAVVPILAICFALAKSLGLEESLYSALSDNFAGQDAILKILIGFAENLISNFSGSLLVFSALAFIFWSVHGLLWQLEVNFSKIFGYLSNRDALRRATDYLTIMMFIPFFLVAAGSINILLASFNNSTFPLIKIELKPLFSTIMVISPVLIWWLILAWTYAYFSRGVIRWRERLIGGFITGLVFQIFQNFYLKIIISITSYNAIYGSFAMVPLFMVWLYISWLIVIFGGELTRRLADYFLSGLKFTTILSPISWDQLKELSVTVMQSIIAFYGDKDNPKPTGLLTLAKHLKTPLPHLGRAINSLQSAGLLTRIAVTDTEDGPAFLPALAPELLTREKICHAIEQLAA